MSFAQGRFSAGGNLALPLGDFADASGLGLGVSARYESGITDNLNWTATAGYLAFGEKDNSGIKFSIIPITGGVKYYFTESFNGFYAGADLGIYLAKAKGEIDTGFGTIEIDDSSSEFGFAPGVGYHLGNIDIQANYNIVADADFFGIRVAYVFGSK